MQNAQNTAIDEAEAYQEYPEAKKIFNNWKNSISTIQYAYYGQIDISELPENIKGVIKNRIRKSLPAKVE